MSDYEGMSAVGYVRISIAEEIKGQTTESQKREITRWAAAAGVTIQQIFKDELSGGNMERPGLQQLIGYLALNRVGLVVMYSVSRMSRDQDELNIIKRAIHAAGAQLYFIDTNLSPEDEDGAFRANMEGYVAEKFRRNLSRNTKIGMETRRGKVHLGRPLACTLAHNVERDSKRINTDGKQQTKIIPLAIIIDAANDGISTGSLAESIGVGRTALESMLTSEGILETYKHVSGAVRENCRKGLVSERVESLYPIDEKPTSLESAVKGSLNGNPPTLSDTEMGGGI